MNKDEVADLAVEGLKMIGKLVLGSGNPLLVGIASITDSVLRAADGKIEPEDAYKQMKLAKEGLEKNDAEADKALEQKFNN